MTRRNLLIMLFICSICNAQRTDIIPKLNSGVISPEIAGRTDVTSYYSGLQTQENFLSEVYGGIVKRPGTYYVYESYALEYHEAVAGVDEQIADYPVLFPTTAQADPGLTHTTAISNVTELQAMNNNLAGNYYLTGDIDASATSTWNGGEGFNTIGGTFTGTFDGCGYTISDLYINRSSTDEQALFGEITCDAKIANVTLTDCTVAGEGRCGLLVGNVDGGTGPGLIQNCHVTGTLNTGDDVGSKSTRGGLIGWVQLGGAEYIYIYDCSANVTINNSTIKGGVAVGGLIGQCGNATVSNCYSEGTIGALTDYEYDRVGGLIGYTLNVTVTYCYSTCEVYGDNAIGGLIGETTSDSTISKCYSTGDVYETSIDATDQGIGGLIGENDGNIDNCYSWSDLILTSLGSEAGGFVGQSSNVAAIYTNCYCIGSVSAGSGISIGGFCGTGAGVGTACFWDTEASGNATSDGDLEEVGHITTWMKTKSNYEDAGWNMTTIWDMDENIPAVEASDAYWEETGTSSAGRLISFEYSTNQSYVLELTDKAIRFYR